MSTLLDLHQGESGIIAKVRGRGAFRRRLTEMGFIKGQEVTVIKAAPLQDPIEYLLMGYHVSLRRSEGELIEMSASKEAFSSDSFNGMIDNEPEDSFHLSGSVNKGKIIEVAFAGNPNCGKTTLFNHASGSHEHVGNYSGVTVDSATATFNQDGYTFMITDLPGTYSLSAYTPEELFVRQHINTKLPDVVVNVVDASNLERNLFLTTQLIDMDIRVVIALNMSDELEKRGDKLDYEALGKMIGIPIIPTVGSRGIGVRDLFKKIIDVFEDKDPSVRHVHIHHGTELEKSIRKIQDIIWEDKSVTDHISSRFCAIKLLEKDQAIKDLLTEASDAETIFEAADSEIIRLEQQFREDSVTLITDAKYGFIAGALKETFTPNIMARKVKTETETIDTFLTHKIFGFPIFIFFLWVTFQATFTLGAYPKSWIDSLVILSGDWITRLMNAGPLKDLIVDGIISGVGSIIAFLPNILILFFFISLMEDTGYMARAAFIMDKLMHKIGLHGKSFIPLIMGFGCNVPAIMATRTLKNRNDRLLTMLINPFMSCSARLPVYILIAGTLFGRNAGTVIFCIYMTGILLAIGISMLFKKTLFKEEEAPFVMELPPYRMPTFKVIFRHMWERGQQYLRKMGGIILVAVIIIWALGYFPIRKDDKGRLLPRSQQLEQSYIGQIGKTIEPVIHPLGFDWRMGVSLISGAVAKEVVVSTMGVLFQEDSHDKEQTLSQSMLAAQHHQGHLAGKPVFTPLAALSFMLFILIYFPCVAVIATVNRESGSWKWALFLASYTTILAWLASFLFYQAGCLLGF